MPKRSNANKGEGVANQLKLVMFSFGAGVTACTATQPFFVMKLKGQTSCIKDYNPKLSFKELKSSFKGSPFNFIKGNSSKKPFPQMYFITRDMIKERGVFSLFTGLSASLFRHTFRFSIVSGTVMGNVNKWIKGSGIEEKSSNLATGIRFISHALFSTLASNIPDRINIILVESENSKAGVRNVARNIWKSEGIRGFFVGFGGDCARRIPASAITVGVRDIYKEKGGDKENKSELAKFLDSVKTSAIATSLRVILLSPLDTARVAMQCQASKSNLVEKMEKPSKVPYSKIFLNILNNRGLLGLYAGTGPKVGVMFFNTLFSYWVFDKAEKILMNEKDIDGLEGFDRAISKKIAKENISPSTKLARVSNLEMFDFLSAKTPL